MKSDLGDSGSSGPARWLEISRVAVRDGQPVVTDRVALPVHSGRDPLALLVVAAEELCLTREGDDVERIDATDLAPFVIPRLDELLHPDNDELRFVLAGEGGEKVGEHTIKRALAKGVWPTNGSVTLEAAVLAVKLRELAQLAAAGGESLVFRKVSG